MIASAPAPLVRIEDLTIALPKGADRPHAVENLSLTLNAGEIVCVVGESGSGKSMTASALMGLLPPMLPIRGGRIMLGERDIVRLSEDEMRAIRGPEIGMIFQEPMTALNPLRTAGDQIAEMFRAHTDLPKKEIEARALKLLDEVGIPDPASAYRAYPHELSGGQRQRVMIAMALALEPNILIADEPTTALDVTIQAQILKLIRDIQRRTGMSVLFITHDFGVVAEIADRVMVMQHGKVVESGSAEAVLENPQHPYTKALIAAVPSLTPPPPRTLPQNSIATIRELSKTYRSGGGWFGRKERVTYAVKSASIELPSQATLGIVGESGSGKSTLARCIVRLLDPDQGAIELDGVDFGKLEGESLRRHRHLVQMVFQDPYASLNPRRTVGDLVTQGLIARGTKHGAAMARAKELFALVGLDPSATDRLPHEFSGGQRQRIGLARALALEPKVLVADEAVSALDVSVQAQVLKLLVELRDKLSLSMIFITHDLRVAAQICDRIAIMQRGEVVEQGVTAEIFAAPQHPYTQRLLSAVPGRAN
ncbi:ABC transporter ATP-binding protein [Bosea rubneri]|uniref:ABC transporter ATP-binding protein n=1 Tax=Bosea rubneri TaxID=3075434 RepID=A0ABU3SDT0_9HYPH|nr:ABC transporter ATP-binding protein [Bosea sp. ZW T0_25]MDU0342948.1 ABC transporter ATP-binding protein [Bosea sp. ZW T0_25]